MRRFEREITDLKEILEILNSFECIRLGFNAEDYPYIIPMNFGFKLDNDKIILYFHGAKEGRKAEIIKKGIKTGLKAAFEADRAIRVSGKDTACSFTMKYESIMGGGVIELIENSDEKLEALKEIMKHYTKENLEFNPAVVERTMVFKLIVNEISAKANR